MSNLSNIFNRFKYWAALSLAEDGPQDAVRAELMKQGWQFKNTMTREDVMKTVIANGMAGPLACIPHARMMVCSPEGEDVFLSDNKGLQQRYKDDVRAAAAKVYGIKP